MAFFPEQAPGLRFWSDIPWLLNSEQGLTNVYYTGYRLSPTVAAQGIWALSTPSGTSALIFDLWFSTDTAMEVQLIYQPSTSGLTARGYQRGKNANGPGGNATFYANTGTLSGGFGIDGAFCAANSRQSLVRKFWFPTQSSEAIALVTAAGVAANCWVHLDWIELNT